ncbi:MAG TPA: HAD-IC family P-type ATPase [Acidimicrobiales bacterium]
MTSALTVQAATGLTEAEAAERAAAGRANVIADQTSRPVKEIIRANVMTRFNALLGSLLVVILIVGPFQDALFGLVLIGNTAVGVFQELRAKRTLDRLVVVGGATATVVRAEGARDVASREVVEGDVLALGRGDQIVVDGPVLVADDLEVDESLLTGESEPVAKPVGATLLSGSWVVAGSGRQLAEVVGEASYGRRLAAEGRRFVLARSELRSGIDTILRGVTWVLVPTAVLLFASQIAQAEDLSEALRVSVGGVVNMVPEGLVLLTSTALAVGIVRLGRRRVLVEELGALEGLARVDVLCLDKTGTLTDGQPELAVIEPLTEGIDVDVSLAGFAASDPDPNASLLAIRRALPSAEWPVTWRVAFSSAQRWSAIGVGDGAWALGAPDVLFDWVTPAYQDVVPFAKERVREHVSVGRRVLLFGWYPGSGASDRPDGQFQPVAIVALGEHVRGDVPPTVAWFANQGVTLKVLSGDEPTTVGAIAAAVGIAGAHRPMNARELPSDPATYAAAVHEGNVFGRVGPDEKLAIISSLQQSGHTVAMVGDGVNDVLALKQADLGVAMGSGASAARSASQVVLLDSRFAGLPAVVSEGRRVIGNIEQVAKLFVTKTVYACLLAISVGIARLPFPFFPRHLTIVSSLTIGIPAFVLALSPGEHRVESHFTRRVLGTAVPAGLVAAGATFAGYAMARDEGLTLSQCRTVATLVLFGVGIWVLSIVVRPFTRPRVALIALMVALFVIAIISGGFRKSFALDMPRLVVFMAAIGTIAVAGALLEIGWRVASVYSMKWRSGHDEG